MVYDVLINNDNFANLKIYWLDFCGVHRSTVYVFRFIGMSVRLYVYDCLYLCCDLKKRHNDFELLVYANGVLIYKSLYAQVSVCLNSGPSHLAASSLNSK